jgi:hypothetical protein
MNNNPDIVKSIEKINKLYDKLSYLDLYGSSVFIFVIITLFVVLAYSFSIVMVNAENIKKDWLVQRCKPTVIPFAGFINKPENKTIAEFTGENFEYCVQGILKNITGYALQPINYLVSALLSIFNSIKSSLNAARNIISNVRTNVQSIAQDVLGRVLNILIPFQQIFIGIRDIMGKIQGVLVSGLYTMLGSYYALQSLMGAILEFIIIILIVLASIIVSLWILPFTWPVAATMTLVFVGIAIPLSIIVAFMTDVLHIRSRGIPGVPSANRSSCFDKSTLLEMNDGSYKKIIDIQVGDILVNNNSVTAKLKLSSAGSIMYDINGVLVSHSHSVKYKDKWLKIDNHPERKLIIDYNEPYLYCLNTTSKEIVINDTTFIDWDELYGANLTKILKCKANNKDKSQCLVLTKSTIHTYLDKGFVKGTPIEIINKGVVPIECVQIGDNIVNDTNTENNVNTVNTVYGIVELGTLDMYHHISNTVLNNFLNEENNHFLTNQIYLDKNAKLYHLLTYSTKFTVGTKVFEDYNSLIDLNLK